MQYVVTLTRVDMHLGQSKMFIYRLYNNQVYGPDQTALEVISQITLNNYDFLFNSTMLSQVSGSMTYPTYTSFLIACAQYTKKKILAVNP